MLATTPVPGLNKPRIPPYVDALLKHSAPSTGSESGGRIR